MTEFKNQYFSNIFVTSSKILILSIYLALVLGSAQIFYESYTSYQNMSDPLIYSETISKLKHLNSEDRDFFTNDIDLRISEQKVVMATSIIVLLLALFMFSRRKYIFQYLELENQNLKRLLADMENYSDNDKVEQFKSMIKNKNNAEIYALMSEMIQELQENQELSDEANKTKSLFLANMSHEIRTPLNGIIGFTKFLTSTELNDEQSDFLKIIRKSSEDLLAIINDILDISKIENGQIILEEVFFNPIEEFENVIESYAANASKKDIDFSFWIDPNFSSILLRSDPGKIKQVLFNLISNAVKFTDNKGSIDVIIEKVEDLESDISVKFAVKDTGIGISKEQEQKVFEAFTQADSSTSRKFGGTGLGLTISAGLVNSLGGALEVTSTLGEGSTFYFTLTMPTQKIERSNVAKPMRMAIYAPRDVQSKDSDKYLEEYLLSFKHLSMMRFKTFDECINAPFSMFDALYIHYDKLNKEEFEQIVKKYGSHSKVVLVTKLNKRDMLKELTVDFTQVLYEPITFSKVEKSFNYLVEQKKENKMIKLKEKVVMKNNENKNKLFSNIHALVVEDNLINQKMILHTLKNMGISADCANDGNEGLGIYIQNHEKYDIVFMDIHMPIMNGVDATKAILAYEQSKELVHTPIVAVTANALKGDRERFMSEGMDEYISKPIDLEKFIRVLKIFFKVNTSETSNSELNSKDILLYKETAMEAKIISAILKKLDYSVDVVDNIEELKKVMDTNEYKCVLLDRVNSEVAHSNLSTHIKSKSIPSLLFVDGRRVTVPSDKENFTFISDKITDYVSIKEKVDQMIGLAKVS